MLSVEKVADGFVVTVSLPHSRELWSSSQAMTATEVLERLGHLGCHSTDITDALYAADPEWTVLHDAEVALRRASE